mgnify:CR=1 FL=1
MVNRIGSKKYPILHINLPLIEGIDVDSSSFVSPISKFKSYFLILKCFGRKNMNINIENDSLSMLNNISDVTVITIPYLAILGNRKDIIIKRNVCSNTLLIM